MSDDPALELIELGGIGVWDARPWFPDKGYAGAVKFRPRTKDQIQETAIHHDAVAFSGRDLDFNGSTVDEERDRMQASYNWQTKFWPSATFTRGQGWNWPGMGYHLYTFPSGRIYLVGDILTIRAHVAYRNTRSGGVVGAGDFTRKRPTPAHVLAYARASAWMWLVASAAVPLDGHRVWASRNPANVRSAWGTSCPGDSYTKWIPDVQRIARIAYGSAQGKIDDMEGDDMWIVSVSGSSKSYRTNGFVKIHNATRQEREYWAGLAGISAVPVVIKKKELDRLRDVTP